MALLDTWALLTLKAKHLVDLTALCLAFPVYDVANQQGGQCGSVHAGIHLSCCNNRH